MPSTPSPHPEVISRHSASFRLVKFQISATHDHFWGGLIPGSSTDHFGLVGHVVPTGQSLGKACEIAARIAANGPLAVRNAKASILSSGWIDDEDARKIEQRFVIEVMRSEDAREGLAAFAAKREPRFIDK
ncbi:MAG: enoyl-CoA hydratase-related protein [Mycobacterium sp.]|uniref:enoyl-CoA hydratase-related protein n=1 Tax=Mycobacterium sp. TaxID=1785 RepID=UPI003F9B6BF7